jgi:predicted DNA-binding protein (UPF0251 family)
MCNWFVSDLYPVGFSMALPATAAPAALIRENAMSTSLSTYDLPLNTLRAAFDALLTEPCHLSLPGDALGHGLPERDIELPELKDLLVSTNTSLLAKHAIWSAIVDLSRDGNATWTVVAAGLAYPSLVAKIKLLAEYAVVDLHDLHAEIIANFLVEMKAIDVDDPKVIDVAGTLCWRAWNACKAFRIAEATCGIPFTTLSNAVIPVFQAGHPDIVLSRAQILGYITEAEQELLSRIYVGGEHYDAVADSMGVSRATFYRRRSAAAAKLVTALESGVLAPFGDIVANASTSHVAGL